MQKKGEAEEEDEDETMRVRISRKIYFPIYLMIAILILTLAYIQFSGKEINPLAFKAVLIFTMGAFLFTEGHRYQNLYAIDNQSIIHIKGILFKKTKRTDLTSVSDVELIQNPWQLLLNYGNVEVSVFSKDNSTNVKNINHPLEFMTFLQGKMARKHSFNPPVQGGGKK